MEFLGRGGGREINIYAPSLEVTIKNAITTKHQKGYGSCIHSLDKRIKYLSEFFNEHKIDYEKLKEMTDSIALTCGRNERDVDDKYYEADHDIVITFSPKAVPEKIALLYHILKADYVMKISKEDYSLLTKLMNDEIPEGVSFKIYSRFVVFSLEEYDCDPTYILIVENNFEEVYDMVEKANSETSKLRESFSVFLEKIREGDSLKVTDRVYNAVKKVLDKEFSEFVSKVLGKIPKPPRP